MTHRRPRHRVRSGDSHRLFYWIVAKDPETGKPWLVKGGWTEEEARQKAFEYNLSDFEIHRLRTTNQAMASARLRGMRLESSKSLRNAGQRIGHERSIRRRIRKRRGF